MNNREYAYMIKFGDNKPIGIMYQLGKYHVGKLTQLSNGTSIVLPLRSYKTISGAERYLLNYYPHAKENPPEIFYETEKNIKKGVFIKGGN